jgi:hypothetical protein
MNRGLWRALDQTKQWRETTATYGGSDSTQLSFNAPRYVRFASVHEPRDFGAVGSISLDLQGLVGAQSGTQTLFFRLTAKEECRLGMRKVPINRYTDQYISIGLSGEEVGLIDLQEDFEADIQTSQIDLGYVTCGYWETGYAELDCQFAELEQGSIAQQELGYLGDKICPPGRYIFTVSSSQWPKLPFHVQIAVATPPVLFGIATQSTDAFGSIGLKSLAGVATMESAPVLVLGTDKRLTGIATNETKPQGRIQRTSPFG